MEKIRKALGLVSDKYILRVEKIVRALNLVGAALFGPLSFLIGIEPQWGMATFSLIVGVWIDLQEK